MQTLSRGHPWDSREDHTWILTARRGLLDLIPLWSWFSPPTGMFAFLSWALRVKVMVASMAAVTLHSRSRALVLGHALSHAPVHGHRHGLSHRFGCPVVQFPCRALPLGRGTILTLFSWRVEHADYEISSHAQREVPASCQASSVICCLASLLRPSGQSALQAMVGIQYTHGMPAVSASTPRPYSLQFCEASRSPRTQRT